MIELGKKFFETDRLILRPFLEGDLEDLYEYASVPEIAEMAGWKYHQSIEDSEIILTMLMRAKNIYAIVLKEEAKVLGSLGFTNNGDGLELGHVLNINYWNRGIEKEAFDTIIDYCFNELGLDEVYRAYYEEYALFDSLNEDFDFEFVKKVTHQTLGLGAKERVITVLKRPETSVDMEVESLENVDSTDSELESIDAVESMEMEDQESLELTEVEVDIPDSLESIEMEVEKPEPVLEAADDDFFDLHAKIDTLLYSFVDMKYREEGLDETINFMLEKDAALAERLLSLENAGTSASEKMDSINEKDALLLERMAVIENIERTLNDRIKFMLEKESAIAERLVQIEKRESDFLDNIKTLEKKEAEIKDRLTKLEQGQKVISVHTPASYNDDFMPTSTPISSGAVALSASPMTMTYGSNGFRIITNPNPIKSPEASLNPQTAVEAQELLVPEEVFEDEELPTVDKVLAASEEAKIAFDTDKILMSEESLEEEIDDLTDRLSKRYDGVSTKSEVELKFRRISGNRSLERQAKELYLANLPKAERLPFRLLLSKAKTKRADFLAVYEDAKMIGLTYVIYHKNTALVLFNINAGDMDVETYDRAILEKFKSIYTKKNILLMFKSASLAKSRREVFEALGFKDSEQMLRKSGINYEFIFSSNDTSSLELKTIFKKFFGSLRYIFKYEI